MELNDSLAVAIAKSALAADDRTASDNVSIDRFTLLSLIAERHAGWAVAYDLGWRPQHSDDSLFTPKDAR